jgi:hypothetical protein
MVNPDTNKQKGDVFELMVHVEVQLLAAAKARHHSNAIKFKLHTNFVSSIVSHNAGQEIPQAKCCTPWTRKRLNQGTFNPCWRQKCKRV